ncbi:Alpha/Beta hydrolase protein [Amylostereum chailletii]|nr:Alpha/Beta hydrolase protein [Amylostereum chailletii]
MVALLALLASALLASRAVASPIASHTPSSGVRVPWDWQSLLCNLPSTPRSLCARQSSVGPSVNTLIGTAIGTKDGNGYRFAVKYGSAKRWQDSTVATIWQLPNGAIDPAALPLTCPQDADASTYSEDCLSALIYVPSSLSTTSGAPTLMWIHGGSFLWGSATDPGLDGMKLAEATQSIVAVVQYRLGALGFMAPTGETNLAVKDMVTCMQFLNKVLPSFGGDANKITLAGQSSGGNMIRALLAAPSAAALFQSAILQSDPMDYGFLSKDTQATLQTHFNSLISCAANDTACLNALSLDAIVNASSQQASDAAGIAPSATQSEPMRPVTDGSFITTTLDSTTPFPKVSKPVLLTNVKDESGPTIYSTFPSFLSTGNFNAFVNAFYGEKRAEDVLSSTFYRVPVLADGSAQDARIPLEDMATDGIWRCATWTFARSWAQNGGNVFVGEYTVGAPHPDNANIPFCQEKGSVCHEDDIMIVFGTVPNPSSAQSALIQEMQARYAAFLHTGNPNPSGSSYAHWPAATSQNVSAILLGSSGNVPVGACDPSFWGSAMLYDYQAFGI